MEQLPDYSTLSKMTNQELTDIFGVRDVFSYELDFAALTHGTQQNGQFTVQADSNFLWQYGAFFADISAATQTDATRVIPSVSLTVQDSGSGRQLMSSGVPIASLFGTGQLPFLLPTPRFFRAQTTVSVSVNNFDAAADYNLKLTFIGTKFFKFAQSI